MGVWHRSCKGKYHANAVGRLSGRTSVGRGLQASHMARLLLPFPVLSTNRANFERGASGLTSIEAHLYSDQ